MNAYPTPIRSASREFAGRRSAGAQALIARNELIRRLRRQGVSDEEIARRYDIGVTTVGKIGIGRS